MILSFIRLLYALNSSTSPIRFLALTCLSSNKFSNKDIIDLKNSSFREIFGDFVSLIFPRYCRGCMDALVHGEELICSRCMLEMPRADYHLDRQNPFYIRFRGRLPVKFVMTMFKFVKGGRVQHLLHALKYKDQPELGLALGRMYGHDLAAANYRQEFDLIVPVPLHVSRKRNRGYNQSEEFGKGLGESLGIECSDRVVRRRISTSTQTRKSKLRRWENVKDVFEVLRPERVKGRRILLVDDVVTTGATLEACGTALLSAKPADLSIVCIASAQ